MTSQIQIEMKYNRNGIEWKCLNVILFGLVLEAHKLPYYASYSHVRLMIHNLCTNHYLDLFITFIICVNVVTMSLEHYSQPHVSVGSPEPPDRSAVQN